MMTRSLINKHVIVTGASSGIGQQAAIEVAKLGAKITLIARNVERLQDTIKLIEKCRSWNLKPMTQYYSVDLTSDFKEVQRVFKEAELNFGPVYMLVNVAGAATCGTVGTSSVEDFKRMFDLNVMTTVQTTKAVLESMKEREEGIIVVTSSLAGLFGIYGYPAYASSKFGLRGFAECLRMEVKPYNISVTLSLPPDTDTPGLAEEEMCKPEETRLITSSGGLYSADAVAKILVRDALDGYFFSTIGLAGTALVHGTAGMSPHSSVCEVVMQVFTMGVLRLVGVFTLNGFDQIVKKCKEDRAKIKNKTS